MKTLYIDVYFLINFTVDLLSLYFGALTAKIKSSVKTSFKTMDIGGFKTCIVKNSTQFFDNVREICHGTDIVFINLS